VRCVSSNIPQALNHFPADLLLGTLTYLMKVDELTFDQVLLNLDRCVSSVRPSLLAHGNYFVFVHCRNRLVAMILYDIYCVCIWGGGGSPVGIAPAYGVLDGIPGGGGFSAR